MSAKAPITSAFVRKTVDKYYPNIMHALESEDVQSYEAVRKQKRKKAP